MIVMKPGDLLEVQCHPDNRVFQWFKEDPAEVENPGELCANELVTWTGEKTKPGYLQVLSRLGIGWVSSTNLVELP